MEGDLKVFPLTEVLELIHAHRRSGVLEVREVIAQGVPEALARRYPVQALASGELSPPGRGWLLRDLTWEMEKEGA
jgi:hypothetical protein